MCVWVSERERERERESKCSRLLVKAIIAHLHYHDREAHVIHSRVLMYAVHHSLELLVLSMIYLNTQIF